MTSFLNGNLEGDMFGTFGMEFSVLGPTLTKNLLKLDVNTLSS